MEMNALVELRSSAFDDAREERGPLRGVPIVVKDCFVDADRAPTLGSRAHATWLRGTAEVLQRLRAAGAVVIGYANLHEWMVGTTSITTAAGPIRNPLDAALVAGGSSGGCAALLAAGHVPLAVGTDAGGSIRIPAACCGVVGLKPSWGFVPTDGFVDHGSPIDHVGPMARSVSDVHLLLEVLVGRAVDVPDAGSLRIGIGEVPFLQDAHPDVASSVRAAVDRIRSHVASIEEIDLGELRDTGAAVAPFILRDVAGMLERHTPEWRDLVQTHTRRVLELGAAMTEEDRTGADETRQRVRAAWAAAFEKVDVIVTPTLPGRIVTRAERTMELAAGTFSAEVAHVAWNGPMNLGGVPCLSLPCGDIDGEPVGVSLTAAFGNDGATIAVGGLVESCGGRDGHP